MREIKFRVWTGIKMEHQVVVGQLGAFYEGGISPTDSACISTTTLYHKETPVMQFTGLRDKNGKEIYEGDICKIGNGFSHSAGIYDIKWEKGCYFVGGGWLCGVSLIEIIGNIHEHPHLLNAKESTEKEG